MFLYKPHVQGVALVTTPDLILEHSGLSSAVQWRGRKPAVRAAWVVIAAYYGPLLTVGLLDGDTPWILCRSAWRLSEVDLQQVAISFGGRSGPLSTAPSPRPGQAVFLPVLEPLTHPASCEVQLEDRSLGRSLKHSLVFLES